MGIEKYLVAASIALAILFFASDVFSSALQVNVEDIIGSESKEIGRETGNNVLKLDYDVLNSGSAGYSARMRLDIFSGVEKTATIWSREEKMAPGERKTISMYWFQHSEGNITAKARLYRGFEIADAANTTEQFKNSTAENSIEISRVKVYGNEIRFRIKSKSYASKIIIYPVEQPEGWLFEQGFIDDVAAGREKKVSINYETGLFVPKKITLMAVSVDGKYYGTATFVMEKEEGFGKWINIFRDKINI